MTKHYLFCFIISYVIMFYMTIPCTRVIIRVRSSVFAHPRAELCRQVHGQAAAAVWDVELPRCPAACQEQLLHHLAGTRVGYNDNVIVIPWGTPYTPTL